MGHLHIFDMDGTLLTGTTANLEVARYLGTLTELHDLEARFAAGTLDTRGFSTEIHRLWRHLTPDIVATAYTAATWLTGITDVCTGIRARGEHSAVITEEARVAWAPKRPDVGRWSFTVRADEHTTGVAWPDIDQITLMSLVRGGGGSRPQALRGQPLADNVRITHLGGPSAQPQASRPPITGPSSGWTRIAASSSPGSSSR